MAQGEPGEALKKIDAYLLKTPDDYRAQALRGDCLFSLGETRAAAQAFRTALRLLEAKQSEAVEEQIDKADLLSKTRQKKKSLKLFQNLFRAHPQHPRLIKSYAYASLDQGRLKTAEELLTALRASSGQEREAGRIETLIEVRKEHWQKAREAAEKVRGTSAQDRDFESVYADILSHLHEWKDADVIYRKLLEDAPQRNDLLWQYRDQVVMAGHPQIESVFRYEHFPQGQRNHLFSESAAFWIGTRTAVDLGMTEEFYRRRTGDGNGEVEEPLLGHKASVKFYPVSFLETALGLRTTYNGGETSHEILTSTAWHAGPLSAAYAYAWNHFVRNPVEAIQRGGRVNTLMLNHRWEILNGLTAGHLFQTEWFRMDGSRNEINGAERLGTKYVNDAFAEYRLWSKPLLSIQYHFRQGYWDQAFENADAAIGFLPNEQSHSGGLYAETRVSSFAEIAASVTRGCDLKRKTDTVVWFFEGRWWIRDDARISFSYEYNVGDSGTAGSGNSQVFTTSARIFF